MLALSDPIKWLTLKYFLKQLWLESKTTKLPKPILTMLSLSKSRTRSLSILDLTLVKEVSWFVLGHFGALLKSGVLY